MGVRATVRARSVLLASRTRRVSEVPGRAVTESGPSAVTRRESVPPRAPSATDTGAATLLISSPISTSAPDRIMVWPCLARTHERGWRARCGAADEGRAVTGPAAGALRAATAPP